MEFPRITLAAARVNAGLTQAAAAEKLGITRSTLQNYENGKTVPDWSMVKRIEEVYQFPADFIFLPHEYALSVLFRHLHLPKGGIPMPDFLTRPGAPTAEQLIAALVSLFEDQEGVKIEYTIVDKHDGNDDNKGAG